MKTIKFSADIFIIPNHAPMLSHLLIESYRNRVKETNEKIIKLNGIEGIDLDKEHFVQTWIVVPELLTDNLVCHSGKYVDPETAITYHLNIIGNTCSFAKSFFEGYKEGDTINIKIPVILTNMTTSISDRNGNREEAIADVSLTLKQTAYRYRRFGNFETVLEDVCY